MNKINQLFQQGDGRKLLSLYFCAGSPTLEGTARVILTLQRRGIDMVEVGIPFSDPLADGPVIQPTASPWPRYSSSWEASAARWTFPWS